MKKAETMININNITLSFRSVFEEKNINGKKQT